jgi:hypothetical protein
MCKVVKAKLPDLDYVTDQLQSPTALPHPPLPMRDHMFRGSEAGRATESVWIQMRTRVPNSDHKEIQVVKSHGPFSIAIHVNAVGTSRLLASSGKEMRRIKIIPNK